MLKSVLYKENIPVTLPSSTAGEIVVLLLDTLGSKDFSRRPYSRREKKWQIIMVRCPDLGTRLLGLDSIPCNRCVTLS